MSTKRPRPNKMDWIGQITDTLDGLTDNPKNDGNERLQKACWLAAELSERLARGDRVWDSKIAVLELDVNDLVYELRS